MSHAAINIGLADFERLLLCRLQLSVPNVLIGVQLDQCVLRAVDVGIGQVRSDGLHVVEDLADEHSRIFWMNNERSHTHADRIVASTSIP